MGKYVPVPSGENPSGSSTFNSLPTSTISDETSKFQQIAKDIWNRFLFKKNISGNSIFPRENATLHPSSPDNLSMEFHSEASIQDVPPCSKEIIEKTVILEDPDPIRIINSTSSINRLEKSFSRLTSGNVLHQTGLYLKSSWSRDQAHLTRRSNSTLLVGPERPTTVEAAVQTDQTKFSWTRWDTFRFQVNKINPGIPLMLLNSCMGSFVSLTVKILSTLKYPTFQMVFTRSIILFFSIFAYQLILNRGKFSWDSIVGPRGFRKLIFFRSSAGFLAVSAYYMSVRHLSVGEATVISFISPLFVGVFGNLFLGEKWEKVDAMAAVLSLLGVTIIANPNIIQTLFHISVKNSPQLTTFQPNDQSKRMLAIGFGILSALFGSTVFIVLRKLKSVPANQILTSFAFFSAWSSILGALIFHGDPKMILMNFPHSMYEVFLLIGPLSLSGLIAQICVTTAVKYEKPATCSTVNSMQVVFSFLFDYIIRGSVPGINDVLGAVIIVCSILFVGITKIRRSLPDHNDKLIETETRIVASSGCSRSSPTG